MWNLNFATSDVKKLLYNKFVVFIGDSVVRTMYKDLVLLLQDDRTLRFPERIKKCESTFLGDELIEKSELTNGKNYREVRHFQTPYYSVRFYFITRVYNEYVESVLADFALGQSPDVVIMNSCVWDITRYGPESIAKYRKNLPILFQAFQQVLPNHTLVIWTTALPVSENIRGGFMLECINFLSAVIRLDILLANSYASQAAHEFGYDTLDLHYYFRREIAMRESDGIHWNEIVHRRITNLILSHVCSSWHIKLPPSVSNDDMLYREVMFNQAEENRVITSGEDFGQDSSIAEERTGPLRSLGDDYTNIVPHHDQDHLYYANGDSNALCMAPQRQCPIMAIVEDQQQQLQRHQKQQQRLQLQQELQQLKQLQQQLEEQLRALQTKQQIETALCGGATGQTAEAQLFLQQLRQNMTAVQMMGEQLQKRLDADAAAEELQLRKNATEHRKRMEGNEYVMTRNHLQPSTRYNPY